MKQKGRGNFWFLIHQSWKNSYWMEKVVAAMPKRKKVVIMKVVAEEKKKKKNHWCLIGSWDWALKEEEEEEKKKKSCKKEIPKTKKWLRGSFCFLCQTLLHMGMCVSSAQLCCTSLSASLPLLHPLTFAVPVKGLVRSPSPRKSSATSPLCLPSPLSCESFSTMLCFLVAEGRRQKVACVSHLIWEICFSFCVYFNLSSEFWSTTSRKRSP